MRSLLLLIALSVSVFAPAATLAQANGDDEVDYWYVTYFKMPFQRIDSLQTMLRTYHRPALEEAIRTGEILERRWLFHETGSEWTLVRMTKYPTWAAMAPEADPIGTAFAQLNPDENQRSEILSQWNALFRGVEHRDEIYTEPEE